MARSTADVQVTIDRPVDEVFAFMARYDNNVQWQEGVTSSVQVTPGEPGVGTQVRYVRSLMGREVTTEATMTACDAGRRLRMHSETALFSYDGGYDFSARGGSTLVHYRGEISTRPLLGLLGRTLAGRFQTQMEGDLQRLKKLLEA
ncbi:MAG: SRPBCC family protein [Alphaproteobacteria bacterium]|nr:SRPBCC family protein [Alphaproteobacteria bacterium]